MMERKTTNQQLDDIRSTNPLDYCQNCSHGKFDPSRGLVCGLTNERGDFGCDCEQFDPNEACISQIRAKKLRQETEKERSKKSHFEAVCAMAITYILCLVSMVRGEENPATTIWVLLSIGFALAGGGIAYYLYHRSLLKKIVFGRLTKKKILNMLRVEGYVPHIDGDGDILFKADGHRCYIQYQDQNPRFILRADWACQKEHIALMRAIAEQVMQEIVVVKMYFSDYIEERQSAIVSIAVEALISYETELSEQLPKFIQIIEAANCRISETWKKYAEEQVVSQNVSSLRRRDIYHREYDWLAEMVDAVTDGRLRPAALSDEAWLRTQLQQDCAPLMQTEWEAFKIVRVDNYGDYKLIVYQFPEPKEVPEALYGAVLLDTTTNHADYYTLEYSFNGKWVYGSTSRGHHANYGEVDTSDLEQFFAWIFSSDKKLCYLTDINRNKNETTN